MYGEITKVRRDLGVGVITADDGQKFRFDFASVRNHSDGLVGVAVYFDTAAAKADDVIVLDGSPWTAFGGINS